MIMARQTAALYGISRRVDPADGLVEEYWRTAGIVAGLEAKVASLREEDVVWGEAETIEAERESDDGDAPAARVVKSRAGLNVWVKLFNEERDRFARLGADIVRLGLEARRDAWVKEQGARLLGLVSAVSSRLLAQLPDALGLSAGQRQTLADLATSEPARLFGEEVARLSAYGSTRDTP